MKKNILYPVSKGGDLCVYTIDENTGLDWQGNYKREIEWIENKIIDSTFLFLGVSRGRSAVTFGFSDIDTQSTYPMFLKDLANLLRNREVKYGEVKGKFTFCKRGSNWGLQLIGEITNAEN